MTQGFLILEKTARRNGAKNVFKKDKTKAVLTINVPLFKKLRDIIFFGGTITL